MEDRKQVAAVVVTYNRKKLLEECITAIRSQSHAVDKVFVINNNSTDGTEKLFEAGGLFDKDEIIPINTGKNLGGAGGFCFGLKKASEYDFDFIWIMDDDTIPEKEALEELLNGYEVLKDEKPGYLASTVFGAENEPMNVPVISKKKAENGYYDWYRYLGEGIVRIRHATFVSLLFPSEVIRRVGYPVSDYFLWGDDTEYTQRIGKYYGEGYFVGKSRVVHKRFNARSISILEEDEPGRIDMLHYYYRNSLITAREYNPPGNSALHVCEFILVSLECLVRPGVRFRWRKFRAVQKGIFGYFRMSGNIRKQIRENLDSR